MIIIPALLIAALLFLCCQISLLESFQSEHPVAENILLVPTTGKQPREDMIQAANLLASNIPFLSGNGRVIAYETDALYVASNFSKASSSYILECGHCEIGSYQLSDDGTIIVYTVDTFTGMEYGSYIAVSYTNGTHIIEPIWVRQNGSTIASISGDGATIAYNGYDGQDSEIFYLGNIARNSTLFQVTNNTVSDLYPVISSDGQTIAYRSDGNIELARLDNNGNWTSLKIDTSSHSE